jgi:hypothetical protein
MNEPIWLSIEEVIETSRDVVLRTGEPFHILNHGLLESAVASPAIAIIMVGRTTY